MKLVLPLGTCRIYRPLCAYHQEADGKRTLVDNVQPGIRVVYPRLGFFHCSGEVRQALRILKGELVVPAEECRLVFRKEPPPTTPHNEFYDAITRAIQTGVPPDLRLAELPAIDVFLVEICSLTRQRSRRSGLCYVANPNLYKPGVAYADFGAEGFYAKFAPELDVEVGQEELTEVEDNVAAILALCAPRPVIFTSHFNHPGFRSATRARVRELLREAVARRGGTYYENEHLLAKHGFKKNPDGSQDIHHLTREGELEHGRELQALILEVLERSESTSR
ncbi:MAG TPA: hypothetical protein PK668_05825 [Myxococcota bacterium]|nr:hypothetical protein [Myxococcota bacterium]HRY92641.1 hypothetical protein [Myxococcota bacterium]